MELLDEDLQWCTLGCTDTIRGLITIIFESSRCI